MNALAQELIRRKRDGHALSDAQIREFVAGITDGHWSDAQIAALAMATLLRGMDARETVALTDAMAHSGQILDWRAAGIDAPVLDKHSTGGVGDKVSLLLAPIVAACGGVVPMVSGRGLAHTGGTLDKMEALPGYQVAPPQSRLLATLRAAGCAIVGAGDQIAPADRRLYAIRDVTATVESQPLIVASILAKKLAAGLQGLVMDVKVGNGAFCTTMGSAQALAAALTSVAESAGLPTRALITDMNQVLGHSAGNAVEVAEAIDFLVGGERDARLTAVTQALAGQLLVIGGLATDLDDAERQVRAALDGGRAAECFSRMVAGLGGPRDVLAAGRATLPQAPVVRDVVAAASGYLCAIDTRAVGISIVALGGGRRRVGDTVDPRVGLSQLLGIGALVRAGQPIARVHAASAEDAVAASDALRAAITIGDEIPSTNGPVISAAAAAG